MAGVGFVSSLLGEEVEDDEGEKETSKSPARMVMLWVRAMRRGDCVLGPEGTGLARERSSEWVRAEAKV